MQESAVIREAVLDWFAAAGRGDASAVDRYVSTDARARLVGSDPAEWLQGGAGIAAALRAAMEGAAGAVTFTPADVEAYEEGSVGWAAASLTVSLPDGRSISQRWTAVFHREEEAWKFVQTHVSIGVPDDQVGWTYGTSSP